MRLESEVNSGALNDLTSARTLLLYGSDIRQHTMYLARSTWTHEQIARPYVIQKCLCTALKVPLLNSCTARHKIHCRPIWKLLNIAGFRNSCSTSRYFSCTHRPCTEEVLNLSCLVGGKPWEGSFTHKHTVLDTCDACRNRNANVFVNIRMIHSLTKQTTIGPWRTQVLPTTWLWADKLNVPWF